MKPVLRYQSQLLHRRSYKPNRIARIGPAPKLHFLFRPARAKNRFWHRVMNRQTQTRTLPDTADPD